ncbi:helix-turn-helix domain-containing protein [Caballeronia sp. LZ065]|uniref:GlxA family transcriptional regulator n=1 Tax=Caballeronia sp. LZ065 TaxID=3038571 RepID=UPI00285FD716|nr:helix-turn-helix domain-containing protein [Caballeronia sp. LZ065]MDR5783705.1 helix-turn-helix domain-containing protein [Caballeronia sp. LZ065]
MPHPTAHIVDILAFPDVQLLDVAGPLQVFATANDLTRAAGLPPPYLPRVVAREGTVSASAGLGLVACPLPPADQPCNTLIVAGGWGVHEAARDPQLVEWVGTRSMHARRTASVCTGAFLLAAAGLLDARRAVTHWTRCAELAARFPAVHVEADPIFIRDGDIWTSAGITAGIDLALALVEEDLGRAMALDVARHLVVFLKRPGGQAQFSTALSLQRAGDRFGELHAWIAEHLASDLTVSVLAERVGMSERSFVRHYRAQTGMTPARAIERMRLEAARSLLGDTRLSVKRVAARCGFGSEETMRRGFLRALGVPPQTYRDRFTGSEGAQAEHS